MKPQAIDATHIKGWGVDADPKNDPTYPIKHRSEQGRSGWERPQQQQATIEVLHSNERPNLPAVFGTSMPPSGLSGIIRRFAFNYSESSYGHWLPLLLADRVNEIEGFLDDFRHGRIPNIFKELGWKAEWKHNRLCLVRRVAAAAVLGYAAMAFVRGRRKRSWAASLRAGFIGSD